LRQGLAPSNLEPLVRGLRDALESSPPEVDRAEIDAMVEELRRTAATYKETERRQVIERRRREGLAFLAAKALEEGVVRLPSGLQYRTLLEGTGRSPGPTDRVTVQYRGTLIDGTPFDDSSTRAAPTSIGLGETLPGWSEGLQRMKEGGRAQLFVPADLAYAERGRMAGQTLIFEVELISVHPDTPAGTGGEREPHPSP
jgi:FKBP-type peptidyl-prolyl cis-trans isomerase FklB